MEGFVEKILDDSHVMLRITACRDENNIDRLTRITGGKLTMELTDILIDLSNSKAALEVANHTIRRMKGKCIRKNILIAGLLWFGFVSCKMVNEAEKQRKEADERAREAEAALAQMTLQKEKDV
jgi:hypothetical protein